MIGIMTLCCATCDKFNSDKKKKRFEKLQSSIQAIADQEFMTIYQIGHAKWTIEKIGDRVSGKRFKVRIHLLNDVFTTLKIFTMNSKLLMFFDSITVSFFFS